MIPNWLQTAYLTKFYLDHLETTQKEENLFNSKYIDHLSQAMRSYRKTMYNARQNLQVRPTKIEMEHNKKMQDLSNFLLNTEKYIDLGVSGSESENLFIESIKIKLPTLISPSLKLYFSDELLSIENAKEAKEIVHPLEKIYTRETFGGNATEHPDQYQTHEKMMEQINKKYH